MVRKEFIFLLIVLVTCTLGSAEEVTNASLLPFNQSNVSFEPASFFGSSNVSMNVTPSAPQLLVVKVVPELLRTGDVQFSILFVNNGTAPFYTSTVGLVYPGFASYSVSVLDELAPGAKGFVLVSGKFEEAGTGNLTVQVGSASFLFPIHIRPALVGIVNSAKVLQEQLEAVSLELDEVKKRYALLEQERTTKVKERYAVSSILLDDAKDYLRDAEAALIRQEPLEARVALALVEDELALRSLQLSVVEKKSFLDTLKENAVLFSTLGGALVMFFTLYELLKKKSVGAVETVKHMVVKKE